MRLAGLRPRLTLLVATVVIVSVGIAFVAVYRGTSGELRHRSENDLRADISRLAASVVADPGTPDAVVARARAFMARQPFRATEHVIFVKVPGRPVVTNQPELLGLASHDEGESADRRRDERRGATAFLATPPGSSIRELPDAGKVRLLVRDVTRDGHLVARLGVGEPTAAVDRSRDVVLDAFLLAGGLAIVVALGGGLFVASRVAAPLRRMAAVATQVDAGDMDPRMAVSKGHAREVKVLGDAFDHMLIRLQSAFDRQVGFVADASHELRTPLTVISGQIEVLGLEQQPDPAEIQRVTRLVREEVERMARLVDDMLLLAQAGETTFLHPSTIDVPEFLDELAAGMAAGLGRTIEIGTRPPVTVRADRDRITQAVRNLLRNAVAHTQGRVVLAAEAAAGRLRFTVDDDGPGIPEAQRRRVFDRFHRIAADRSPAEGGAGLGLPIAQAIAEAHDGRAWAESSALGGARMVIELPLDPA
jgi:signal transduction histidine kinase